MRTFANAPVQHAEDLLASFEMMKTSPSHSESDPPSTTVQFIERIEQANPNAPGIEEDDTNVGWGHWQFTAGSMTCRTILKTWLDIGNVATAYRLLAASLKTCLVARHLCFTNNISVQSSYLSDAYLQQVVDILWNMVSVDAGVVSHTKYPLRKHATYSFEGHFRLGRKSPQAKSNQCTRRHIGGGPRTGETS